MKRNAAKFVGLALLLLLAPPFYKTWTVQATTWSAPTRITPSLSIESKPYVFQDSGGILWVVYESLRSSNFDIYSKRWNGTAWSTEDRLTNHASADQNPAVTQLGNGTMLLAWSSNRLGDYSLFTKRLNGGVWSTETQLTATPGTDSTPTLLQSRNGTLWVFWTRKTVSGTNVIYDIYYKTYTNGVWTQDAPLVNSTASEFQLSALQADNGTIWVVYASDTPGNFDLYYKTFTGTWSAGTRLTTNADDDRQAWIMQDLSGAIWVFWARCVTSGQTCQDDVFYMVSSNYGGSWSSETKYTSDPTGVEIFDSEPAAVNARDKKIYLFWTTNLTGGGGDFDIYYSTSDLIPVHDVGVWRVAASPISAGRGMTVAVTVNVENKGDYQETTMVNLYARSASEYLLGTASLTLGAHQSQAVSFQWATGTYPLGTYQLRATAGPVAGEALASQWDNEHSLLGFVLTLLQDVDRDFDVDLDDVIGVYVHEFGTNLTYDVDLDGDVDLDDLVSTYIAQFTSLADVAVTNVTVSRAFAYKIGSAQPILVRVTVANYGVSAETFTVTIKANQTVVGSQTVNLASGATAVLSFSWNAHLMALGTYQLSAEASGIPGERVLSNNVLSGGQFQVRKAGDVDADGDVDIDDLISVYRNQFTSSIIHDIDNDGDVDIDDVVITFLNQFR